MRHHLIGKTEVGADVVVGIMHYFIVWRHDDVRWELAGAGPASGYARRKAAHTAERRKQLHDISAVVEIHVTRLWPAVYTNLLAGTHGWNKCEIVAKSRIDRQLTRGSPGIL